MATHQVHHHVTDDERTAHHWRLTWWWASALTALNGFVVGAGSVWFQLFGESPDRGDYLVSAGGYLTAAAVISLALAPALGRGVPTWGAATLGAIAAGLAIAGLISLQEAAALPPHNRPSAGVLDGVGGVLFLPWCWVLLWMCGRAAYTRTRQWFR